MTMPGFDDDVLHANQRGRLTERQRQQLQRQDRLLRNLNIFCAASSAVMVVIGVLVGPLVGSWFTALMVALGLIEFGVLTLVIRRFRRPFQRDAAEGRVERLEGEARTLSYRKRRMGFRAIYIGDKQVYADPANYQTLAAGGRYRAYVAPATSTLMSFERVEDN